MTKSLNLLEQLRLANIDALQAEASAEKLAEALRQIATVEARDEELGQTQTQSYEIAKAALADWQREAQS